MDNSRFYGSKDNACISYLEFGEINLAEGKKAIWDFRLHQKAYDWLMLGRYTNDLLTYRTMGDLVAAGALEEAVALYGREMHHAMDSGDNLAKLCALAVMPHQPSFFEFGQTLFGCIDGMRFSRQLLDHLGIGIPAVDLDAASWYGVDISAMFNQLSAVFHPGMHVVADTTVHALPESVGCMFAKGVTLHYAMRSVQELLDVAGRGGLALFDYSVALGPRQEATIGSGKTLCYLTLDEVAEAFRQGGKVLHVSAGSHLQPEKQRLWLYCLAGEAEACARFMSLYDRTRAALAQAMQHLPDAQRFHGGTRWTGWQTLDAFLTQHHVQGAA